MLYNRYNNILQQFYRSESLEFSQSIQPIQHEKKHDFKHIGKSFQFYLVFESKIFILMFFIIRTNLK